MESSEDCRGRRFLRPSNNVWDDREATLLSELHCLSKYTSPDMMFSFLIWADRRLGFIRERLRRSK